MSSAAVRVCGRQVSADSHSHQPGAVLTRLLHGADRGTGAVRPVNDAAQSLGLRQRVPAHAQPLRFALQAAAARPAGAREASAAPRADRAAAGPAAARAPLAHRLPDERRRPRAACRVVRRDRVHPRRAARGRRHRRADQLRGALQRRAEGVRQVQGADPVEARARPAAPSRSPAAWRWSTASALLERMADLDYMFDVREPEGFFARLQSLYGGDVDGPVTMPASDRLLAYVPVMGGCNEMCTYCIVPFVRGRESSRATAEIVDDVQRLVGSRRARGHPARPERQQLPRPAVRRRPARAARRRRRGPGPVAAAIPHLAPAQRGAPAVRGDARPAHRCASSSTCRCRRATTSCCAACAACTPSPSTARRSPPRCPPCPTWR